MLSIPITVNLFFLVGSLAFTGLLGFAFRSAQIKNLKNKICSLEKDMLVAHADILELQSENAVLEQKLKESSHIPVIPINAAAEEKKAEKIPDVSMRKKLLSQKSAEKHS
jgi:hypothetical protein